MIDTLNVLKPFISTKFENMTYEELSNYYKVSNDAYILASSYSKIYKLAINISEKYWGLTSSDYASFCLEKLDYCLKTYNPEYKFTTYFATVYGNKLREETENLNRKKRKCVLESINDLINIGIEDTYNVLSMILPTTLTYKERIYCELASKGYDNAYIAEQLNVSRMTICNIRKSLQNKLADLQFN